MIRTLQLVALGAFISVSGFAGEGTLRCRTFAPKRGVPLLFEITDNAAHVGDNHSLFGGAGSGTVRVRPIHPLKLQFPTHFDVKSYWSKRYSVNVFTSHDDETLFRFNLTADANIFAAELFTATIRYGRLGDDRVYQAHCQFD